MELSIFNAKLLIQNQLNDWKTIEIEEVMEIEWRTWYRGIFYYELTKSFYCMNWDIGGIRMQLGPFEELEDDDKVPLTEVTTKQVNKWVPVESKET